VSEKEELEAAAQRIREGDRRVDIELRGALAVLLDGLAEHADSEYACCDNGFRQCWEIGSATMPLADMINGKVQK
jgi:hypothetical protein